MFKQLMQYMKTRHKIKVGYSMYLNISYMFLQNMPQLTLRNWKQLQVAKNRLI